MAYMLAVTESNHSEVKCSPDLRRSALCCVMDFASATSLQVSGCL